MASPWKNLPPITSATPILAILAEGGMLWAGGAGGVACLVDGSWELRIADLALGSVVALSQQDDCLIAGGVGGVARSHDGGITWRSGATPGDVDIVTALAASPGFRDDGTALAGTLDAGILRTADSGLTWANSSFGMGAVEILTLRWIRDDVVLAGTPEGLFRSPNGGRAWRTCADLAGQPIVGIAILESARILAATFSGELYASDDGGQKWSVFGGGAPSDVEVNALVAIPGGGLLLGTSEHGLLHSATGDAWSQVADRSVLSLAVDGSRLFAGTDTGALASEDGGLTWRELPPPPVHDLRRLDAFNETLVVSGIGAIPVRFDSPGEWLPMISTPLPIACFASGWNAAILVSTPDGLFQSTDRGDSWTVLVEGEAGWVSQIATLASGEGWMAKAGDSQLSMTRDSGATWEDLASPFGVLPLVALQVIPQGTFRQQSLLAATFDSRQHALTVWLSEDEGTTWQENGRADSEWSGVTILPDPPTIAMGNLIAIYRGNGMWERSVLAGRGVRRIVTSGDRMVALSTSGIWRYRHVDDGGWEDLHVDLPMDKVMDIALAGDRLYCLNAGGEVVVRDLESVGR